MSWLCSFGGPQKESNLEPPTDSHPSQPLIIPPRISSQFSLSTAHTLKKSLIQRQQQQQQQHQHQHQQQATNNADQQDETRPSGENDAGSTGPRKEEEQGDPLTLAESLCDHGSIEQARDAGSIIAACATACLAGDPRVIASGIVVATGKSGNDGGNRGERDAERPGNDGESGGNEGGGGGGNSGGNARALVHSSPLGRRIIGPDGDDIVFGGAICVAAFAKNCAQVLSNASWASRGVSKAQTAQTHPSSSSSSSEDSDSGRAALRAVHAAVILTAVADACRGAVLCRADDRDENSEYDDAKSNNTGEGSDDRETRAAVVELWCDAGSRVAGALEAMLSKEAHATVRAAGHALSLAWALAAVPLERWAGEGSGAAHWGAMAVGSGTLAARAEFEMDQFAVTKGEPRARFPFDFPAELEFPAVSLPRLNAGTRPPIPFSFAPDPRAPAPCVPGLPRGAEPVVRWGAPGAATDAVLWGLVDVVLADPAAAVAVAVHEFDRGGDRARRTGAAQALITAAALASGSSGAAASREDAGARAAGDPVAAGFAAYASSSRARFESALGRCAAVGGEVASKANFRNWSSFMTGAEMLRKITDLAFSAGAPQASPGTPRVVDDFDAAAASAFARCAAGLARAPRPPAGDGGSDSEGRSDGADGRDGGGTDALRLERHHQRVAGAIVAPLGTIGSLAFTVLADARCRAVALHTIAACEALVATDASARAMFTAHKVEHVAWTATPDLQYSSMLAMKRTSNSVYTAGTRTFWTHTALPGMVIAALHKRFVIQNMPVLVGVPPHIVIRLAVSLTGVVARMVDALDTLARSSADGGRPDIDMFDARAVAAGLNHSARRLVAEGDASSCELVSLSLRTLLKLASRNCTSPEIHAYFLRNLVDEHPTFKTRAKVARERSLDEIVPLFENILSVGDVVIAAAEEEGITSMESEWVGTFLAGRMDSFRPGGDGWKSTAGTSRE